MKTTILVVEDDQFFARVVERKLKKAGYEIFYCKDGEEGWKAFCEGHFDLCLFDINMPQKNGYQLAMDVREADQNIPIIFMSVRATEDDRIHGFEVGCDDYIVKPFNLEELVMRVKVWLKRSKQLHGDAKVLYNLDGLVFDFTELYISNIATGTIVQIQCREAQLLAFLCEHANEVVTKEFVLMNLWEHQDIFAARCLDVYLTRLRKHLNTTSTTRLETLRKNGLRLVIDVNSPGIKAGNQV